MGKLFISSAPVPPFQLEKAEDAPLSSDLITRQRGEKSRVVKTQIRATVEDANLF